MSGGALGHSTRPGTRSTSACGHPATGRVCYARFLPMRLRESRWTGTSIIACLWLFVGVACRDLHTPPAAPAVESPATARDVPLRRAPEPTFTRHHIQLHTPPFVPPHELELQRATIRFRGRPRTALLAFLPGVLAQEGREGGVLLLRWDGGTAETIVAPSIHFPQEQRTYLRYRVFHDELYLELRLEPVEHAGITHLALYRIDGDAVPRAVLQEDIEVLVGRCGLRDTVELSAHGMRDEQLRIEVRRRRVSGRRANGDDGACGELGPGVRRQTYAHRDGCFQPQRPQSFTPWLTNLGATPTSCTPSACSPEEPASPTGRALLRRDRSGVPVVTIPDRWQPVDLPDVSSSRFAVQRVFDVSLRCRLTIVSAPLPTPSRYVHTHMPLDLKDLVRSWLYDCYTDGARCAGLKQTEPTAAARQKFGVIADPAWDACGDLQRGRASDGTTVFDAIALRVPLANGSSAALLTSLVCEQPQYEHRRQEFEALMDTLEFE